MSKISEELQTGILTFFRMVLESENIIPLHRRDKILAVVGSVQCVGRIGGHNVVGMNKIEQVIIQPFRNRVLANRLNTIPANVRNFEADLIVDPKANRCPFQPA